MDRRSAWHPDPDCRYTPAATRSCRQSLVTDDAAEMEQHAVAGTSLVTDGAAKMVQHAVAGTSSVTDGAAKEDKSYKKTTCGSRVCSKKCMHMSCVHR